MAQSLLPAMLVLRGGKRLVCSEDGQQVLDVLFLLGAVSLIGVGVGGALNLDDPMFCVADQVGMLMDTGTAEGGCEPESPWKAAEGVMVADVSGSLPLELWLERPADAARSSAERSSAEPSSVEEGRRKAQVEANIRSMPRGAVEVWLSALEEGVTPESATELEEAMASLPFHRRYGPAVLAKALSLRAGEEGGMTGEEVEEFLAPYHQRAVFRLWPSHFVDVWTGIAYRTPELATVVPEEGLDLTGPFRIRHGVEGPEAVVSMDTGVEVAIEDASMTEVPDRLWKSYKDGFLSVPTVLLDRLSFLAVLTGLTDPRWLAPNVPGRILTERTLEGAARTLQAMEPALNPAALAESWELYRSLPPSEQEVQAATMGAQALLMLTALRLAKGGGNGTGPHGAPAFDVRMQPGGGLAIVGATGSALALGQTAGHAGAAATALAMASSRGGGDNFDAPSGGGDEGRDDLVPTVLEEPRTELPEDMIKALRMAGREIPPDLLNNADFAGVLAAFVKTGLQYGQVVFEDLVRDGRPVVRLVQVAGAEALNTQLAFANRHGIPVLVDPVGNALVGIPHPVVVKDPSGPAVLLPPASIVGEMTGTPDYYPLFMALAEAVATPPFPRASDSPWHLHVRFDNQPVAATANQLPTLVQAAETMQGPHATTLVQIAVGLGETMEKIISRASDVVDAVQATNQPLPVENEPFHFSIGEPGALVGVPETTLSLEPLPGGGRQAVLTASDEGVVAQFPFPDSFEALETWLNNTRGVYRHWLTRAHARLQFLAGGAGKAH